MIKTNPSGDTFLIYKNRDYGDYECPKDQELMPEIRWFLFKNPNGKVKISRIYFLSSIHYELEFHPKIFWGITYAREFSYARKKGSDTNWS